LFIIKGWINKQFDKRLEKHCCKVQFVIARDSFCGYLVGILLQISFVLVEIYLYLWM